MKRLFSRGRMTALAVSILLIVEMGRLAFAPASRSLLTSAEKIPLPCSAWVHGWLSPTEIVFYGLDYKDFKLRGVLNRQTGVFSPSLMAGQKKQAMQVAEEASYNAFSAGRHGGYIDIKKWHDSNRYRHNAPADIACSIKPPKDAFSDLPVDMVLSPDGSTVALLYHLKLPESLMYKCMKKIFPKWKLQEGYNISLYTCRIDGSQMKLLGSLIQNKKTRYLPRGRHFDIGFQSLKWTPDGKHLSFLYDDSVWVLPLGT